MSLLYVSRSAGEYPLDQADACILGIPFDSTAAASGNQRFGPWSIRYALQEHIADYYIPEKKKTVKAKLCDLGNLQVVHGSFEKTDARIREAIKEIREINPKIFPIFLGGEHSITLSIVRALKPKTIVSIDAHSDMWKEQWGEKYAHSTWLYHAQKELGCKVVLLGARTWDSEHEKIFKSLKFSKNLKGLKGPVYLSIDVDAFDPRYAPDTGFPEPAGLTPKDVLGYIDKIFKEDVVGMDVVEINSEKIHNPTSYLASRLIIRALSHLK